MMSENEFDLDKLLQETLSLSEFITTQGENKAHGFDFPETDHLVKKHLVDSDYLFDLADSIVEDDLIETHPTMLQEIEDLPPVFDLLKYPTGPGLIYKIDQAQGTFCVRGVVSRSIRGDMLELSNLNSSLRPILRVEPSAELSDIAFFETKNAELAEAIKEQIINRRFPKFEDSLCNIADPGFSWWMNVSMTEVEGRFEIYFKSHGVNRAEKYIQLGPIGDGGIAEVRLNQAKDLIQSSFPVTEYYGTDKSLVVATSKPDHLSFLTFKNIFLLGENHTALDNFPDNSIGRTLFYYFQEIAVIRKFWIEVQKKLN